MKFIIGLSTALITMILLSILNHYVLKFTIPEFMIGWLCCMGYYISVDFYQKSNHSI